jgi:hypothetical protein
MDKKQQEKEKRETPITDGDARPDMPTDPRNEKVKKPGKRADADKKFESERLSDMNSLEDYKDAQ